MRWGRGVVRVHGANHKTSAPAGQAGKGAADSVERSRRCALCTHRVFHPKGAVVRPGEGPGWLLVVRIGTTSILHFSHRSRLTTPGDPLTLTLSPVSFRAVARNETGERGPEGDACNSALCPLPLALRSSLFAPRSLPLASRISHLASRSLLSALCSLLLFPFFGTKSPCLRS